MMYQTIVVKLVQPRLGGVGPLIAWNRVRTPLVARRDTRVMLRAEVGEQTYARRQALPRTSSRVGAALSQLTLMQPQWQRC